MRLWSFAPVFFWLGSVPCTTCQYLPQHNHSASTWQYHDYYTPPSPPWSHIHWFTWLPSLLLPCPSIDWLIPQAFFSRFSRIFRALFYTIRAFQWHLTWPIWSTGSCAIVIFIISPLSSLMSSFLRRFSAGSHAFLGPYSTQSGLSNDTLLDLFGPQGHALWWFSLFLSSPHWWAHFSGVFLLVPKHF
jgi:hypothetical protein